MLAPFTLYKPSRAHSSGRVHHGCPSTCARIHTAVVSPVATFDIVFNYAKTGKTVFERSARLALTQLAKKVQPAPVSVTVPPVAVGHGPQ